jgi:hypothetical protein
MNIKKIKRRVENELNRQPFMRFAKETNPLMYNQEFNKLFNKEVKYLNEEKIGKTESKRHMDFLQAESEFAHINNPWLRKHLARNKLKKRKKL